MKRLAGVFLEMKPRDTNALGLAIVCDGKPAAGGQRQLVLGDLIALRKIGIKVVFASETGMFVNSAVQREGGSHAHFYGAPVQNGQCAGQSKTHRADIGIWRIAKSRRAATENLSLGQKLRVNFQTDDRFVLGKKFGRQCRFGSEFRHGRKKKYIRAGGLFAVARCGSSGRDRFARLQSRVEIFDEREASKKSGYVECVARQGVAKERQARDIAGEEADGGIGHKSCPRPDGKVLGDDEELAALPETWLARGAPGLRATKERSPMNTLCKSSGRRQASVDGNRRTDLPQKGQSKGIRRLANLRPT